MIKIEHPLSERIKSSISISLHAAIIAACLHQTAQIVLRINLMMASNTLPNIKGPTPKKSVLPGLCRCCNQSKPYGKLFDLFGMKARSENLVEKIHRFSNLEIHENDNLPSKICHSCHSIVTRLDRMATAFHKNCKTSNEVQRESLGRSKRQHSDRLPEQPSHTLRPVAHNSPNASSPLRKTTRTSEERSQREPIRRQIIFMRPQHGNLPLQPGTQSTDAKTRVLPTSLTTVKTKPKSREKVVGGPECIGIITNSGIRNLSIGNTSAPVDLLSDTDVKTLVDVVFTALPKEVAKTVMGIEKLKTAVKNIIFQEIDKQCKTLCTRTQQPSVLFMRRKDNEEIKNFSWLKILNEMKERAPDVLDFIRVTAAPTVHDDGRQVAPICMIYALMMHTRWRELSLCQKIVAVVLGIGHATERTFQRLSSLGLSQSRSSYTRIMDDIGGELLKKLRLWVQEGRELRVIFDNFDFKVLANILLQNHRNSDMHWIAHYATYDRVATNDLDDTKPLIKNLKSFENHNYLLSSDEVEKMKKEFTILVARVLLKYFPCMKPLFRVVPNHIEHKYSDEMAKKSEIVMLPVVPFNQNKHSDVVQYLDWLQNLLFKVYNTENSATADNTTKPGAEQINAVLNNVKVPLGGDLLGRERMTGARKTRLGCDLPSERFESLVENVALWHCKQSFLQYVWEKLYQATPVCGKEIGSLYYFRQLFRLTNVTKKVKQNYSSCESLLLSTTNAYICAAFMEWADLESLDDSPKSIRIPGPRTSLKQREVFLENILSKFVEEYVLTEFDRDKALRTKIEEERGSSRKADDSELQASSGTENLERPKDESLNKQGIVPGQVVSMVDEKRNVLALGNASAVRCNIQNERTELVDCIGVIVAHVEQRGMERNITPNTCHMWPVQFVQKLVVLPPSSASTSTANQSEPVPRPQTLLSSSDDEDRVMNYGLQVLQLGVLLMQLNDTESEGDGERALRNWKLLLLYFRARSHAMKYAYEAMRVISYTKALLSEKMAARILHGQFINIKGGKGNNVANDLKMEHLIKYNKVILHDLCGNKSLKAVQRNTKATYGLQTIINAFDKQCDIKPESTAHTHMSKSEDEKIMIEKLIEIKPFRYQPGRKSKAFPNISKCLLDEVNPVALDEWLKRHKRRLAENPNVECDESDGDNEEADDESDEEVNEYEITEDHEM